MHGLPVFQLTTLLAATDFSQRSATAVARAAELAREHKARLVLVHAIEARPPTVQRLRLRKPVDPVVRIEAQMQKLREAYPELEVTCHIAAAKPGDLVPQQARELGADLIVLGLHMARRVLETVRLTNLERITQNAPCPILIAHDQACRPYRTVLGAITFAPASAKALQIASTIAPEGEFHAIHALQLPLSAKLPSTDIMKSAEMTEAEMLRETFMTFNGLPKSLSLPEIVPGGVHEVLQFRIRELQPDLVVIGSHSGRDPNTLGNYARDLMRAPPTDMLVAKPD